MFQRDCVPAELPRHHAATQRRAQESAQLVLRGIGLNAGLAAAKFAGGIFGHTYALIADQDPEHGRILRLIEKPRVALNDWMGTGNCVLRHEIFDYVARTPVNAARGEKE